MISIVVPTYQEEKYIGATLANLKSLDKNFEIVVSDSRSTDRTAEIAKRYTDHVVVLGPGRKRGLGQGRNDGAWAAHGDYLVFIDADVTIPDPPGFFKKAQGAFAENPRLVAITAKVEVEPRFARTSDKIVFGILDAYFAVLNNVFNIGMAAGEFQMIKTEAFRKAGGFNENLAGGEDVELFYRLSRIGRVHTVWGLTVYHTGRRFHEMGWAKTVYHWIKNALFVWLFKRSADKVWTTVR